MSNKLFLDDIKIISQSVRRIVLSDDEFLLEELDYDSAKIDYKVFYNKEKEFQHLIAMHFAIDDFVLLVEGIYEIKNGEIKDDKEKNVIINYGSLNLLIDFLKTCIYSISSLTKSKPINIPLINLKELILLNQKSGDERKEKSSKSEKGKDTPSKNESGRK